MITVRRSQRLTDESSFGARASRQVRRWCFAFLIIGAVLAAVINSPDRVKMDGMSDEEYEELIRMAEERKKKLDDD